jgi:hypothetical protein
MVQAPTALHENVRMGWEDLPGTAHKHFGPICKSIPGIKFCVCSNLYLIAKTAFMVGLHYGDYRSKLVHFESQMNIFYV